MIDQLLACLRSVNLQPTPEELAEALWLAQYLPPAVRPVEPARAPLPPATPERPRTQEPASSEPPEPPPVSPPAPVAEPPQGAKLVRPELSREGTAGAVEGSLVRAPAVAALPDALRLGNAFRPLRRRVPSRTRLVLDEAATVYQVAETQGRLWSPIFAPARARWLELALVVDASPSMSVWSQTISEFERLLERLGAFRDVRRWTLETADPRGVRLYAGHAAAATRTARPLRELIDPAGRRLVLVVSDCIAPAWNTGGVMQAFSEWGRAGPVALVQVLPQRLWVRTGLGSAVRAPLSARTQGALNVHLEPELRSRGRLAEAARGLPMPIFPFDPPAIREWARMVAGGGRTSSGLVLPLAPWESAAMGPSAESPRDPAALIQSFQGTASPLAQALASQLSAAPLYLPAMRLVQRVMLPQARQVHLAEVLLGGLLKEVKREGLPAWGGESWYEFHPGVRERLLDSLKRGSALEVLRQVSDFLGLRFGQGRDFAAALVAPDGELQLDAAEANEPFAVVAATVLRRLGGKYAKFAERLQAKAPGPAAKPQEEASREPTPGPGEAPAAQAEAERIRQACALVISGRFMTNAYLIEPKRFITSVGGLGEVSAGDRVRVRSVRGWHEATVLGTDFENDCAVVELDDVLEGVTPLELTEETPDHGVIELYGLLLNDPESPLPWKGTGRVSRVLTTTGGSFMALQLEERASAMGAQNGMPVVKAGRVVGHVNTLTREGASGSVLRGLCSARNLRRLLSPGEWKPRGQRVLVAGTGDVHLLTPEISRLSRALGVALAREGYALAGGGWPGVDELVGRAYLATLRLIGTPPHELFLQIVAPGLIPVLKEGALQRTTTSSKNEEEAIRSADAVILIGGADFTEQVYTRARALGKPVFPLPGLGGTSASSYKLLLKSWKRNSFGGLTPRELERLNYPCTSSEQADLLASNTVELVNRALAEPRTRPAEVATAMLDLLLATEPLFADLRPTHKPGPAWMAYAKDLVESIRRTDFTGVLLERLGHLVVSSGRDQKAQRYDALAALRGTLPESAPWLRQEFITIGQVDDRGALKWYLLAQLAPLVLGTPEEGLAAISTVLKQTKGAGPDEYIEVILHAVEEQFESPSRFRQWLFDTLGERAWESHPVPGTLSLLQLARAYLERQDHDATQRALVGLREELSQMSLRSRDARLPAWLESSDASKQLLAYILIQLHPTAEVFDGLLMQLQAILWRGRPLLDSRILEVLLITLMVVVEAASIGGQERLEVEALIREALDRDPERWPKSRDERPMGQLHMLRMLCGMTARPIKGLTTIGPRVVVLGDAERKSPRRWGLAIDKVRIGQVSAWPRFIEDFKTLPLHERFVAFNQEAHLIKRGLSAKKLGKWRLFFEVAEPLPRTTFSSGREQVGDFVTRAFSRAFSDVQFWGRLNDVMSRRPEGQSWALLLNNLLRLEAIRLAALPANSLDPQPQPAVGCIDEVWNVVALRNRPDRIFEVGMVLNIRGYGPWAGIVPLTQASHLPPRVDP